MTDEEQKAPFEPQEGDETPAGDSPEHNESPPTEEGQDDGSSNRDLPEGNYKSGVIGGESESDPVTDVGQDAPTP